MGCTAFEQEKALECGISESVTTEASGQQDLKSASKTDTNRDQITISIQYDPQRVSRIYTLGGNKVDKISIASDYSDTRFYDNTIHFKISQGGCFGDGYTIYRKSLLIKGTHHCKYGDGTMVTTDTSGACKPIMHPKIKEEKNKI